MMFFGRRRGQVLDVLVYVVDDVGQLLRLVIALVVF